MYRDSSNYFTHYFGKINTNNTITQIWSNRVSSSNSWYILDYDDQYIYVVYCVFTQSNNCIIRRFDLNTKVMENTDYWTITLSRKGYSSSSVSVLKRGCVLCNGHVCTVDCVNKIIITDIDVINKTDAPSIVYNPFIFSISSVSSNIRTTTLCNYESGITKSYTDQYESGAVNYSDITAVIDTNKIIIRNNLYELNDDLSQGVLLKENIIDNYVSGMVLVQLASNYFIETALTNKLTRRLYKYDDVTNTFTVMATVTDLHALYTPGSSAHYLNAKAIMISSNVLGLINIQYDESVLVGYTINGHSFLLPSNITSDSNKILAGNIFYNSNNIMTVGTMPNNGALTYTPTTSQQTIPEGYTSGGTISAVTSAIDVDIIPENIKKDIDILGVTGTLEEGVDTSDANAIASDIKLGKTAYVNGIKLTGTHEDSNDASTIKIFGTVQEMQNDSSAEEGDLAVVYKNEPIPIQSDVEYNKFIFPDTINLGDEMNVSVDGEGVSLMFFKYDDSEGYIFEMGRTSGITNDGAEMEWTITDNVSMYRRFAIHWATSDGVHFTKDSCVDTYTRIDPETEEVLEQYTERTDTINEVELPINIYYSLDQEYRDDPDMQAMYNGTGYTGWMHIIGSFFQTENPQFNGLYQYKNGQYQIAPTQLTLSNSTELSSGVLAYGTTGVITGTYQEDVSL